MKNKMMKKVNKRLRKAKMKSNVLMEMAEDLKDLITNAKIYKQLKHKKWFKNRNNRFTLY